MTRNLSSIVTVVLVLGFTVSMALLSRKAYFDYSLERHKLCLSGAQTLSMSSYDCSQITAAADAAYDSATAHVVPMLTMFTLLGVGLAFRLSRLEKEVTRLKENIDV